MRRTCSGSQLNLALSIGTILYVVPLLRNGLEKFNLIEQWIAPDILAVISLNRGLAAFRLTLDESAWLQSDWAMESPGYYRSNIVWPRSCTQIYSLRIGMTMLAFKRPVGVGSGRSVFIPSLWIVSIYQQFGPAAARKLEGWAQSEKPPSVNISDCLCDSLREWRESEK